MLSAFFVTFCKLFINFSFYQWNFISCSYENHFFTFQPETLILKNKNANDSTQEDKYVSRMGKNFQR